MEQKNSQLKAETNQNQSPEYLEKVARESLDYKKPGEDVVVVKSAASTTQENASEGKEFLAKNSGKNRFINLRVWFNGRTCPSQGQDTGSIPVTRSVRRCSLVVEQYRPFCCRFSSAVEQLFRKQ